MKRWLKYIILIGGILVIDALIIEPYSLKVTVYELDNPQLAGSKIVFATDFHVAPYPWEKRRLQKIIDTINKQNADLVILGGDYVNRHSKNSTMSPSEIAAELKKIATPKVAVLGNHDSYYGKQEVKQALENVGIPVLDNRNMAINLGDREVFVAGVADYNTDTPDPDKALQDVAAPVIFITHSPDVFAAIGGRAEVVLAGHTHGGQIVLPFFGPLLVPTDSGRKYAYGLIYEDGKPHIVSSGLGTSMVPLRFFNRPEIAVITFK